MHPRALFVLFAASALALAAWACGSFGDSDDVPSADGGAPIDGAAGDAATNDAGGPVDGGDGGGPVIGTLLAPCPRPPGPTVAPSVAEKRQLYVAPDGGIEQPFGLATDSTWVYWTTLSEELPGDTAYNGRGAGKIMRVDRSGANSGAKASVIASGQRDTVALAMVGDYLYWVAMESSKAVLRRTRRDCSSSCPVNPVVELGSTVARELAAIGDKALLAIDGNTAWIIDLGAKPPGVKLTTALADYPALTVTNTAGFLSAGLSKDMKTVPLATLAPGPFASIESPDGSALQGMSPLTNDCQDLYGWRGANQIWKIAIAGGPATHFKTVTPPSVFGFVTDQGFLYMAAPNGPGVVAVSLATGNEETVKSANVHRIAVDDEGVYWGDHDQKSGGGIWMMVK